MEGFDYITPNPFAITFGTDTVGDTSTCISIITVDDTNFEGDHCFTVSIDLATPPTVVFGTPSSVAVILMDNEGTIFVRQQLDLCQYICILGYFTYVRLCQFHQLFQVVKIQLPNFIG